jgi:tetratricopeptide (TPR) repeat protein
MVKSCRFRVKKSALVALVALVAAMLAHAPPASAQSSAEHKASIPQTSAASQDDKRAAAYVAQAKAALAAGDSHEALRGFRDAWNLAKTPAIAANLATIEASFGHHRDAAEHFQFALSHLPPSATTEQKQAVAAGLDTEKQQVVTLVVRGAPVGASLSIDGQIFGIAPYTDNLFVEFGHHEVRAEAPGYESLTQTITGASIGTTIAVQLALRPLDTPPPALPKPQEQQPVSVAPMIDTNAKPSTGVLAVGGGLAVVGAALGTVYMLKASSADDEATKARADLTHDNACFGATAHVAECNALRDANSAVRRDQNIATASFIVDGAAAVGTLVYWLWPRSQAPSAPVASAIVGPGYAAVQARWSW